MNLFSFHSFSFSQIFSFFFLRTITNITPKLAMSKNPDDKEDVVSEVGVWLRDVVVVVDPIVVDSL